MRRWLIASVAVVGALVAACGSDGAKGAGSSEGTVKVVAAFYPLAEAATRVGGDRAEVANVTPPGTEPHDIELTSRQVDAIEGADVIIYLGDGFQPAVEEVAKRSDGTAIDLLADEDLLAGTAEEGEEPSAIDPHIWLDPVRMAGIVERVRDAYIDADPDGADAYRANAATYLVELAGLNDDFESGLGHCERHDIVTTHAAFAYLSQRYGLKQAAIAGLSPESEPDPARLADLADQVKAEGITTIFYETLVSPDIAESLAREADVDSAVLNPIEGLTDDEVAAGGTYASVMRENLAALQKALGCS